MPMDMPVDQTAEIALNPRHDERARYAFIIDFKRKVNFDLQADIRALFNDDIKPEIERELGGSLDDLNRDHRRAAKKALSDEHLFKSWEALTWISQGMMWDAVDETIDHDLPAIETSAAIIVNRSDKKGSLTLNPDLDVPPNIGRVEIHRQPGGFCLERDGHDFDMLAGARMTGGGLMYGAGKAPSTTPGSGYGAGYFLLKNLEAEFGPQKPTRILDVGCGTGLNTLTYARQYPDAEVVGIDVAPGLLRWGHAKAESLGVPIHFKQMDSAHMDFEDESFDMIVSTIWGHETTPRILKDSIAEMYRVLKPGGVSYHMDVSNQPGHLGLVDQVLNDWQIRYNGEPFWMGWADADVRQLMIDAGYPEDSLVADYRPRPGGKTFWFVHGVHKPA